MERVMPEKIPSDGVVTSVRFVPHSRHSAVVKSMTAMRDRADIFGRNRGMDLDDACFQLEGIYCEGFLRRLTAKPPRPKLEPTSKIVEETTMAKVIFPMQLTNEIGLAISASHDRGGHFAKFLGCRG